MFDKDSDNDDMGIVTPQPKTKGLDMKFGIGIMTCERFDCLSKCVNTLLENSPYLKKFPLIIGDDGSSEETLKKTKEAFPNAHILHVRKRRGMSANIKQIHDFAEAYLNLDYLYFSINDIICTRPIDFYELLEFMSENPKVGQIQFVRYKGHIGDPKRERANFNWTEEFHKPKNKRKPVKFGEFIKVGDERIRKTTYSYVNLPAITRLHQCDIARGTIEAERRSNESLDKFIQRMELRWVKNWYDTGLENWETEASKQPFLSLDVDVTRRTEGIKA